jgi:hypothetical protein
MTALALVLSVLLGQSSTSVWTDAQGEDHFTDDPSTIPKGVKVRTTQGRPISLVPAATIGLEGQSRPAAAPPVEVAEEPAPPDRCLAARARLAAAEQRLADVGAPTPEDAARDEACQRELLVKGQGSFAACMATARGTTQARRRRQLQQRQLASAEVEAARDQLRRVTYAGCH